MLKLFLMIIFLQASMVSGQLYQGGIASGNDFILIAQRTLATPDTLFNGGRSDGFARTGFTGVFAFSDSMFKGGKQSGFDLVGLAGLPLYITDSMYNGGEGKGETYYQQAFNLDINCSLGSTWNGNVSNVWSNPGNWDCNALPGPGSIVIIPSGKLRYPVLFLSAEIKSLIVEDGASVSVRTGVELKLTGQ